MHTAVLDLFEALEQNGFEIAIDFDFNFRASTLKNGRLYAGFRGDELEISALVPQADGEFNWVAPMKGGRPQAVRKDRSRL